MPRCCLILRGHVMTETSQRDLHGRQLNSLNQEYMLPADNEEMTRLRTQHNMFGVALGGPYPENYSDAIRRRLEAREGEVIRICDFGSGSGDWILDMARAFPHTEALGIDLAPAPIDSPANVQFKIADVTKEMPEYYGAFDLIQSRCVGNGISDYPALINSASRYLKPGGIFILAEGFLALFDENQQRIKPNDNGGLAKLFAEVASRQPSPNNKGIDRVGEYLEGWLKEQGDFGDIKTQAIYVPLGWDGSPALCKEPAVAGRMMLDNMMTFAGAWKPMFMSMGVPEADVDKWVALAKEEVQNPDVLKVYCKYLIVCATKCK